MNARTSRPRRRRLLALVTLVAALPLGCRDSGLPDRNLPLDQAENRTFGYPAYQAAAGDVAVWELAGNRWQAGAHIETIEARLLASVAHAAGTPVYALAWDREPYDRLYTPVGENRWRVIERID